MSLSELTNWRRAQAIKAEQERPPEPLVGSESDPGAQARLRLLREAYGSVSIAHFIWTSNRMAFQRWRWLNGRLGEHTR